MSRIVSALSPRSAEFRANSEASGVLAETLCGHQRRVVDGDRERIPYEADAYLNQLAHYGVDREFALARYSHEYLLANPTWPTEWLPDDRQPSS